jgi:carboxypeptidase T
MKSTFLAPLILLLSLGAFSQNANYLRLTLPAKNADISLIASLGIEAVYSCEGDQIILEVDKYEQRLLDDAGITYKVVIDDLENYYRQRNEGVDPRQVLDQMRQSKTFTIPEHFALGSMGGFFTYSEILQHMDNMATLFPDLISSKDTLPGLTVEGRPVYWQRISGNPQVKQNKPKVFYNALIHAREPASMQQLIFFMYYLLENYALDGEVKMLVDNLELYFVPCLNPDGYLYIESTNPEGGGMWRKNRKNNGNGIYGVDLNRNFGFMWGYDNFGSSPNPGSSTYRGTAPFSEPETQMIRDFTMEFDFNIVLNYHSYGSLLLHPYGYSSTVAPDYPYIRKAASAITEKNGYTFGTSQRLLYLVNGDATDWFYGDEELKPRMISFTPEVGTAQDGFWPEIDRIVELCVENLHANLMTAKLAGSYAEVFDSEEINIAEKSGDLEFGIKRLGLTDEPVEISIEPLTGNILSMQSSGVVDSLPLMEIVNETLTYTLCNGTFPGDRVEFVITLQNGFFSKSDTIRKIFGPVQQIFFDSCNDLTNWNAYSWHLSTANYSSPPSSFLNHNGNFYPNNGNGFIYSSSQTILTTQNDLWVSFKAQWDLDGGRDFVTFVVSKDNGMTWQPYGGRYTVNTFVNGEVIPLYQGETEEWVTEKILIHNITDQKVRFGFKFESDQRIGRTGFFFDDFEVLTANTSTQLHEIIVAEGWSGISSFLAPVHNNIQLLFGTDLNAVNLLSDGNAFFQPFNPGSNLTTWDSKNGYLIKADSSFVLVIDGYPEKSVMLEFEKGLNMLPVLTIDPIIPENIETMPPDAIIFITDACGLGVFWPQYDINTLGVLQPGRSYFIQLAEDATLILR